MSPADMAEMAEMKIGAMGEAKYNQPTAEGRAHRTNGHSKQGGEKKH